MGFSVKNKSFVIASSDLGTLVNAFKTIFLNDILPVNKMIIWITKLSTAELLMLNICPGVASTNYPF